MRNFNSNFKYYSFFTIYSICPLLPRELYLDYLKLKYFPMETLIWVKLLQKYFQFRLLKIAFVLRMRGD